jgi:hypothetical protein
MSCSGLPHGSLLGRKSHEQSDLPNGTSPPAFRDIIRLLVLTALNGARRSVGCVGRASAGADRVASRADQESPTRMNDNFGA